MQRSYTERREMLEVLLPPLSEASGGTIDIITQLPATRESIRKVLDAGGEGVMLKKVNAPYEPGKRSQHWLKVKRTSTASGIVTGWKEGENSNKGKVGSLELSLLEGPLPSGTSRVPGERYYIAPCGDLYRLVHVAQVGNMTDKLRKLVTAPGGGLNIAYAGRIAEFRGQSVGTGGKVRHPELLGFRDDKGPLDCMLDQLDIFERM